GHAATRVSRLYLRRRVVAGDEARGGERGFRVRPAEEEWRSAEGRQGCTIAVSGTDLRGQVKAELAFSPALKSWKIGQGSSPRMAAAKAGPFLMSQLGTAEAVRRYKATHESLLFLSTDS